MILRCGDKITLLLFKRMKEVLFFQQGLTGFKVWGPF
jgi:hypothetical protein